MVEDCASSSMKDMSIWDWSGSISGILASSPSTQAIKASLAFRSVSTFSNMVGGSIDLSASAVVFAVFASSRRLFAMSSSFFRRKVSSETLEEASVWSRLGIGDCGGSPSFSFMEALRSTWTGFDSESTRRVMAS